LKTSAADANLSRRDYVKCIKGQLQQRQPVASHKAGVTLCGN